MAFELFGFSFGRSSTGTTGSISKPGIDSFVAPDSYDGTYVVESGGLMASVYDFGGLAYSNDASSIQQYRAMSLYPEVDMAIEDIVNESLVFEPDGSSIRLDLTKVPLSENIKRKINEEYDGILKLLDFKSKGYEYFRRWYIDGRLFFHNIIDTDRPERGIQELRSIDPTKITKVRKIDKELKTIGTGTDTKQIYIIKNIDEHFLYTDMSVDSLLPTTNTGIKISTDSITYIHSGIIDQTTKKVMGYLHKAIRPLNMLRQIEDAVVIYRMSRAPERRIFYVDVGNLPKQKAEQYMKDLMVRYRNKLSYDPKTGQIKDDWNHNSMLEDFWIPRRDGGRGTEITTLDGGQQLGQLEDVDYLLKKLFRSLNVPLSRLEAQNGFNMGRMGEITRDEVKFFKFIERMRMKFSELFLDLLKKQCILKGIMTTNDWKSIEYYIEFKFNKDSYFDELKNMEILKTKVDMLGIMQQASGTLFSDKYIRKQVLNQTDEEMAQMDIEMAEEREIKIQQQIEQQQRDLAMQQQAQEGQSDAKNE
jgi:hypothetical protein